jgi:single-strand DNA-binding protein
MVNRITLVGRLGSDTDLRENKSGKPYTLFSIATSSGYKDAAGQWKEIGYWHNIIVNWKVDAKKGELIFVEGELTYYTTTEGVKNTQIKAQNVKVLSNTKGEKKTSQVENSAGNLGDDLPF